MSFQDIAADGSLASGGSGSGSAAGVAAGPGVSPAALNAQRALGEFDGCARKVQRAMEVVGTRRDSAAHRATLQESIETAMAAALATRKALALVLAETAGGTVTSVTSVGSTASSASSSVARALHAKLSGDFERRLELLNVSVQKVLTTPAPSAAGSGDSMSGSGMLTGPTGTGPTSMQSSGQHSALDADATERLLRDAVVFNQEDLEQREQGLSDLHRSVMQLNEVYIEVAEVVERQGEDIDQVERQVEAAEVNTAAGLSELLKSSLYRRKVNPCAFWLMILLLCAVIAVSVLLATQK